MFIHRWAWRSLQSTQSVGYDTYLVMTMLAIRSQIWTRWNCWFVIIWAGHRSLMRVMGLDVAPKQMEYARHSSGFGSIRCEVRKSLVLSTTWWELVAEYKVDRRYRSSPKNMNNTSYDQAYGAKVTELFNAVVSVERLTTVAAEQADVSRNKRKESDW